MNRSGPWTRVFLASAVVLLWGCEVDPLQDRNVPQVGTVFTGGGSSGTDIYIPTDVEAGPSDEAGVEFLEPGSGSPAGGDVVFVHGWGFTKSVLVYFDETPALDVFYVNSKKLRVQTPPHGLGFADVSVRWNTGKVRTLVDGFLYETDLAVDSVQPDVGPIAGGTPITVTGAGFTADSQLLVGDRLALNIEVADDNTIFAITPPGSAGGPADVFVSNASGVASQAGAFTYSVLPRLDSVSPAAGPVSGGNEVTIEGRWLAPVTSVLFGDLEAEIVTQENQRLVVVAPAGEAGPVDVVALGTWGWDSLADGYTYIDTGTPGAGIVAVTPDHGPEAGGNLVTIAGCDLLDSGISTIRFGEASATVVGTYPAVCAVVVEAPAGTGTVDVTVLAGGTPQTAPAAYAYQPTLALTGVEPKVGPHTGGTTVRIAGENFSPDLQVMFGPMPAADVSFVSPTELEAVTPPGSPGLADVTVLGAGSSAQLNDGFLFTVKSPRVWVVTPDYGAQAGGTFVEVLGAGFSPGATVAIGAQQAAGVEVRSYGKIWLYSPPNSPDTYDVTVNVAAGEAVLPNAFSYFDPTSWYGGTWGPPIDGSVNVTVLDAALWEPLEGATVVLGADPQTRYIGQTDLNGQVTLSGPGLRGPVDMHATKADHDAASIVHFDAENATVYLIPRYPPSTGPTEPVEPLAPGNVTGRVVGLGKYVVVPQGECSNKTPGPGSLCQTCMEQSDCDAGSDCLTLGKTGRYCTTPCSQAEDCPPGYMCGPVDDAGNHCVPALGVKTARCELTRTSIYTSTTFGQDPWVEADPDDEYRFILKETRLGEVAIVCLGGWSDPDTKAFHPLAMGVRRHINVAPGALVEDQNIWLNIPLTRDLRLRMDHPPRFDDYGGVYRVTAFLDFGSDGIYKLPGAFEGYSPDDVLLTALPEELSGDIYDAHYIVYAGAYSNTDDQTPYSIVYLKEVTQVDGSSVARLEGNSFVGVPAAPVGEVLNAAFTVPDGTWIVGDGGRIFGYTNGNFYQLPTVVNADLYDLYGFPDSQLFAVGEDGVILRGHGTSWQFLGAATDKPLRGVWGSDPNDVHAVGQHRIVSFWEGAWHEQKVSADLYDVWGSGPDSAWAVGNEGALLRYDGTSWHKVPSPTTTDLRAVRVFAGGQVLLAGPGGAWLGDGQSWAALDLAQGFGPHAIAGEGIDQFYLVGNDGRVARFDGAAFTYLTGPDDLAIQDLFFDPDGVPVAVGTPALLLAPFIPFPKFVFPADGGPWKALYLDWTYEGDASPISLHTVSITRDTGTSQWRLTVDGAVSQVVLPDFPQLIGWTPVSSGPKRIRIYSAHSLDFSINAFDLTYLGTSTWRSWAYDMIAMDEDPVE